MINLCFYAANNGPSEKSHQEEPGFRRMPIIRARATTKNAELNAELLN